MAEHAVITYHFISYRDVCRIGFFIWVIFTSSEGFPQTFFPVQLYDCYTYNYYSYDSNGWGNPVITNNPFSFTCLPAFYNGKEYFGFTTSYYRYDSLTNTLKIYLNNTDKLAVDFNRLSGTDTLYYDNHTNGLQFTCAVYNEYYLGRLRKMYKISSSFIHQWPQYPVLYYYYSVSYKFAEGIGEVEKSMTSIIQPEPTDPIDTTIVYRNIISLQRGDSLYNLFSSPFFTTAVYTPGVVNLNWLSSHPWLDSYQILRKEPGDTAFTIIAQLSPESTAYADTVVPGRTFVYSVRAIRDIYYSSPDTVVVNTIAQPGYLSAENQGDLNVKLQWSYSYQCDSFVIERCRRIEEFAYGPYAQIASVGSSSFSYNDLTVIAGDYYKYRVKAVKDTLISPPGNEASIMPLFPFLPPEAFTVEMNDYECAKLSWSDPNQYSDLTFEISRKKPGEPVFQILILTPDTIYIDENIIENETYIYRVRGKLGWKFTSSKSDTLLIPPFNPLPPPGNLAATVNQEFKVELSWADNSSNEKYFIIGRGRTAEEIIGLDTVDRNTINYLDMNPKLTGNDRELFYAVRGINPHSQSNWSITQIITGITETQKTYTFELSQNYPNPFNPSTTINYSLPERGKIRLSVYDPLGREVRKLVDEEKDAGKYEIKFNADGLASGMYFYRLSAGEKVISKKMILLK